MSDASIITALFGATGMLFAILGVPLFLQKVPPNMFYGFRTARTLSSTKIWFAVNRACGRNMIVSGFLIAGIAGFSAPLVSRFGADAVAGFMVAVVLTSVFTAFVLANKIPVD